MRQRDRGDDSRGGRDGGPALEQPVPAVPPAALGHHVIDTATHGRRLRQCITTRLPQQIPHILAPLRTAHACTSASFGAALNSALYH
ncbi:hypothetical protein GCM10020218_019830 [Dactylosporangium vinaceum]